MSKYVTRGVTLLIPTDPTEPYDAGKGCRASFIAKSLSHGFFRHSVVG